MHMQAFGPSRSCWPAVQPSILPLPTPPSCPVVPFPARPLLLPGKPHPCCAPAIPDPAAPFPAPPLLCGSGPSAPVDPLPSLMCLSQPHTCCPAPALLCVTQAACCTAHLHGVCGSKWQASVCAAGRASRCSWLQTWRTCMLQSSPALERPARCAQPPLRPSHFYCCRASPSLTPAVPLLTPPL